MINAICTIPTPIVYGVAAFIGGTGYAIYTVLKKKQADKTFKFEWTKIVDTVWQSIITGFAAAQALNCSYYSIIIAMVAAIGIDKIANKIQIDKTAFINIISTIAGYLQNKDKK